MPDVTLMFHHRWDNIKWNVALDADDFRPPAEEDIAKAATIQVPTIDEAAFVDGMRAWLESKDKAAAGIDIMKKKSQEKGEELPAQILTMFEGAALDAGYPERLDGSWLRGTFAARATLGQLGEMLSEWKPIPDDLNEEERAKLTSARAKEAAMAGGQATIEPSLIAAVVACVPPYGPTSPIPRNGDAMLRTPSDRVPDNWRRYEFNGQYFYLIPVGNWQPGTTQHRSPLQFPAEGTFQSNSDQRVRAGEDR